MPDPVGASFQLALLTGKLKTCRHRPLEEAVMRPTQLTSLVLAGLLVSASSALAGRPSFRPSAPLRAGKSQVLASWVVHGFGQEEKDAKLDALRVAKEKVLTYLT